MSNNVVNSTALLLKAFILYRLSTNRINLEFFVYTYYAIY